MTVARLGAAGPTWGGPNTCKGKSVPASANVLTVNTKCGYWNNLIGVWLFRVIGHEQQHENGANKCLTGGQRRAERSRLYGAFDGDQPVDRAAEVHGGVRALRPRRGPFKQAMETRTSTPVSPVIWEWRDKGAWTEQALRPVRHNGEDGCLPKSERERRLKR